MSGNGLRAFFYLSSRGDGEIDGFPHNAIAIAEGLSALGWQISSDARFWQPQPGAEFLFPGDGIASQADSQVAIVGEDWFLNGVTSLPKIEGSCPLVVLQRSDLGPNVHRIYSPELRKADLILRCHSTDFFRYPENVQPWCFGLSNRIIAATSEAAMPDRSGLVWNFRMKNFPHSVRIWAEREVKEPLQRKLQLIDQIENEDDVEADPYQELMHVQTGRRHFGGYFRRLGASHVCACFGGWFLFPVRQSEAGPLCMVGRKFFRQFPLESNAIAQWDSWRLWEAFAAGSAVLHVDFERHGFRLPGSMPEPMKEYIPVSLQDPLKSLEPLLDDFEAVRKIGEAGRIWALANYGPPAMARNLTGRLGLT